MLKTRLASTTALVTVSTADSLAFDSVAVIRVRATNFDTFDVGLVLTADAGQAPMAPNEINGSSGNDEGLYGTSENDRISGLAGDDYLYGLAGNDVLDGGTGADVMAGGTGNDAYFVDNAGDIVWEWGGQGFDTVYSSVDYTMPTGIEVLLLRGGSADEGIGNELNNSIHANEDTGADCLLDGGAGNDTLYGSYGDDRLIGGTGNDILIGWQGADVMQGGEGNDSYQVMQAGDLVVENFGQGTDTVSAYISYTLTSAVENLYLRDDVPLFDWAIDGTGNELANVINGNRGANAIRGGLGQDIMNGGMGADRFVFATPAECGLSRAFADQLPDFSAAEGDRIDLSLMDAKTTVAGNDAFTFIGTNAAYTGTSGELRYMSEGYVEGDLNGDAVSDFFIAVNNVNNPTLSAGAFVL